MMPTNPYSMPHPPIVDNPIAPASVVFAPDPPPVLSSVEQAVKDAGNAAATELVKVKVLPRLRVVHEGKPYVGGQTLMVPGHKAHNWIKNKFVELVPSRSKPASQKGES